MMEKERKGIEKEKEGIVKVVVGVRGEGSAGYDNEAVTRNKRLSTK